MRVSSAKAKGRRLQQQMAKILLAMFPSLSEDDVRSNPMGSSGEDVWLSKAARDLFPFTIECKNVEKLSIWAAIEQARSNKKDPSYTDAVVFSKNHEETYIALPLNKFMEIYEKFIKSNAS